MLTYYSNSTIKYTGCIKNLLIVVVANNKTIHAPTLFILVKILKEFRLSLLSIDYLCQKVTVSFYSI